MIVHDVEQGSAEWLELRSQIPTASNFSQLVTPTGKKSTSITTLAAQIAANIYSGENLNNDFESYDMKRGRLLEPVARNLYGFLYNENPEEIGFITDDGLNYGCSPDSLVSESGLLEIKCLSVPNHTKAIAACFNDEIPSDYIPQIQGQIYTAERDWCDLFFYHPKLPPNKIRVFRDESFIKTLAEQLDKFKDHLADYLSILENC